MFSYNSTLENLRRVGLEVHRFGSAKAPYWLLSMKINERSESWALYSVAQLRFLHSNFRSLTTEIYNPLHINDVYSRPEFVHKWRNCFKNKPSWSQASQFLTSSKCASSTTSFKKNIFTLINEVDSYREKVNNFSGLNLTDNTSVLAHFIVQDSVQLCSKALTLNLTPVAPAVTAVRENIIPLSELDDYAAIPENWVVTALFQEA